MDALATDLYQLTMAAGYFHRGMTGAVATCEMFVRRLPRRRRYLLAMGLERALVYLENLRFTEDEIAYLATVPALRDAMTPAFADFLRALRFTGDVDAMPEGTAAFANEPLVRVRGPLVETQLVETFLLSAINHATMIASKAARVVESAGSAAVIEFGTRRTHPAAAVDAARAAYAAGFAATSNVEAGKRFGVPVTGTAAHMWTMAHDSEEEAFAGYTAVFPSASILLIDTYDTRRGAERAAKIAGDKLKGVRLDSGDLLELSRAVRVILDENGCKTAQIVASGDLNEIRIAELRAAGAPIDSYGVGTDLVTSLDAPALGGVYKLVELTQNGKTRPIAKFSEGKGTFPGAHQVLRFHDAAGKITRDLVTLDGEATDPGWGESPVPLLIPVMRAGKRVAPAEPLAAIRARAAASRASLPADLHLLEDPTPAWVGLAPHTSPRLTALVAEVRAAYASPQKESR
ncbi:MAG: nicotinate phosphoribosyltransferase [Byssovorax sp.]